MPNEETYLALQEAASLLNAWEAWRERALQALDTKAVPRFIDAHDTRINLLLAEGQARRALELADDPGRRLPLRTWELLLPHAEECDPPSAVRICHLMIEANVGQTKRYGYLQAVELLQVLQRLYCRQSGENARSAFASDVARYRQLYRPKRMFIELLDARFPAA